MNKHKRLLFVVNVDWFFVSHRLPIALAAMRDGYEVHVAVSITDRLEELLAHGLVVHPLRMRRGHAAIWAELGMLRELVHLFRRLRPDLVHLVTIRPVIYGGIAARWVGVPSVVVAISGLGFVFGASGLRARLRRATVTTLYRLALGKKALKVVFQNEHDLSRLVKFAHLGPHQFELIRGSGVDLARYANSEKPIGIPSVLMACRLIAEKGVWEFVEAARLLKQRGIACRFWLAGDIDPDNPTSLTETDLDVIRREGNVEILGVRTDIPELMARAHAVVLPSYYGEGVPKVLIEAAACGRAIVTTDIPGCRDVILPDRSGLLIAPRDALALADAIGKLFSDQAQCTQMGLEGRKFAERNFNLDDVVARHLKIYEELLETAA